MYKTILVPLDGSTFGEHALPLAISMARRAGARLILQHVHAPLKAIYLEGAAFLDESVEEDIKAQQRTYLEMVKERVKKIADIPIEAKLAEGEVASGIAAEAVSDGADLVVMTTHGRGVLGRFWLGSTADELIRLLPMPVLLIRPHEAAPNLAQEATIQHILIALDGTDLAEQIIAPAVALGQHMDADYTLVRIIKPVMPVDAPIEAATAGHAVQAVLARVESIQKTLQEEAQKYLNGVAEKLRAQGLNVQTRVDVEDQPGLAIVKESERPDVDMIAMATHGRRGLKRFFLGSVADKVIRSAAVPVLLHRPVHK